MTQVERDQAVEFALAVKETARRTTKNKKQAWAKERRLWEFRSHRGHDDAMRLLVFLNDSHK